MVEESSSSLINETEDDHTKAVRRRTICGVGPSPYPIFIATAFYFVQVTINQVALDAVIYNKICFSKFNSLKLCMNSTFTETHPSIQQETLTWGTYGALAQLPLSIIITLVLGSYCDRVGHKLPYLLSTVGGFLSTGYLAILATPQFIDWPIASVLGFSALSSVLGNSSLVLMSSFSYVALITPKKNIAIFMALAESSLLIGMLIGNSINGPITDATSLTTLIYINAGISFIPTVIVSLFVIDVTHSSESYTWRDVIGLTHISATFKCVYKKREGYNRSLLQLSFALYGTLFIASAGFLSCSFLYFVKEIGMSMTEYSFFSSFQTILQSFGGPLILILLKNFTNVSKSTIVILSCGSLTVQYIIMSVTAIPHGAWIGGFFVVVQITVFGEVRSLQTSLCSKDELGKMFAYDSLLQLLMGIGSRAAFRFIYSASITFYPEAFLSLAAIFNLLAMVVAVCIDKVQSF